MLQTNNYMLFTLYTLGSVALGIIAVALGYITADAAEFLEEELDQLNQNK